MTRIDAAAHASCTILCTCAVRLGRLDATAASLFDALKSGEHVPLLLTRLAEVELDALHSSALVRTVSLWTHWPCHSGHTGCVTLDTLAYQTCTLYLWLPPSCHISFTSSPQTGALLQAISSEDPAVYDTLAGLKGDQAGVRSVAAYIEAVADAVPSLVLRHASGLRGLLGYRHYPLRSAAVTALGHVLDRGFEGREEDASSNQGTGDRCRHVVCRIDAWSTCIVLVLQMRISSLESRAAVARLKSKQSLWDELLGRALDESSFTRARVLQVLSLLAEQERVPLGMLSLVVDVAAGALSVPLGSPGTIVWCDVPHQRGCVTSKRRFDARPCSWWASSCSTTRFAGTCLKRRCKPPSRGSLPSSRCSCCGCCCGCCCCCMLSLLYLDMPPVVACTRSTPKNTTGAGGGVWRPSQRAA